MKINHIICVIFSVGLGSAVGCDQNKSGPVATPPEGQTAAVEQAEVPSGTQLYQTGGPAAAVPVNTPTDVELEITPVDGFKINKRFTWNFEFHSADGVQLESASISSEQVQLDDAAAKIPVKVTATSPGEHTLTATGNFSICNDDKCELYRDREVTFKMAATDG